MPEYAEVLIRCGATVVVAFVITRICLVLVRRFQAHVDAGDNGTSDLHRRSRTLASVLRGVILAVVWTVAAITVLDQAGVQVAPILAAAGIAGLALGFGAQSLVKDILAGFFILMENQYDVGDVIQIAGVSGTVEAVNMRTTVLRSVDGNRHVVPNGEITVSSNQTKVYSRYLFVLPVPYEENVDRAVSVLKEVAAELGDDPEFGPLMTAPLTVLGVDEYGDSSVDVKCYVETIPGEQWKVGRELRKRLKAALDEEGIGIPYPHREIVIRKILGPEEAD
ncbi:MAG: moderate conductance mechanosensitive channel [Miltoncostaeaceae bacterium]|jgi:small conductance mechanosensitive channel|nr:moderate conductance mechanosensitive channel [Miltoncostaeaceae bacterium]